MENTIRFYSALTNLRVMNECDFSVAQIYIHAKIMFYPTISISFTRASFTSFFKRYLIARADVREIYSTRWHYYNTHIAHIHIILTR